MPLSGGAGSGKIAPMRQRRILIVLALAGVLRAPREAAACQASGPYLGTGPQLPLGCPLHVYVGFAPGSEVIRKVTVLRGGMYVDVTGTVMPQPWDLLVDRTFVDCQLQPIRTDQFREPYQRFAILPQGVAVGERIGFGTGWFGGIEIVAAGPCAAPIEPRPSCTEVPPCGFPPPPPFESFESNGCGAGAAGGGGAAAIGLALLGLARRRRRR